MTYEPWKDQAHFTDRGLVGVWLEQEWRAHYWSLTVSLWGVNDTEDSVILFHLPHQVHERPE